jgi:hypothetical protein
MEMPEIRMMATTGMLGYGYTEEAFQRGLEQNLDFIAADSGSMDPGPHYLGEGVPFVSRQALKRDLALMLEAAVDKKIPMLIGSAGGGGSEPQLALVREVVEEIATEKNLHFDMALIHSEQSAEYLKAKLADGKIEAQVVLAGRATDASIYSAIPLMRGAHAGLSWHLSKIIECAGQVTTPRPGQDCVIGTLRDDHFLVEPGHPDKRCTRMRIAAHTLYENPSPYRLEEPDGTLVTINSVYEQLDERIVKVSGSQFEPSAAYTVKLEGVKESGYRTVFIAGVRDPILISVIDDFIESCHERVALEAQNLGVAKDSYRLNVRVYGKNATMGPREPVQDFNGHEIGLLVDVLASDADTSKAIMAKARYALLHTDFPGRKCISGNLAIPFSPSDMPVGMTYQFNIWHRMEIDDPLEPFPIEYVSV